MKVNRCVACKDFPCRDVDRRAYIVPRVEIDPDRMRILLISEAAPPHRRDYYYAPGAPAFAQTTLQAFNDAGARAASIHDLLARGIYFTTAVKCGKTGYAIAKPTIKQCSLLLEKEIALFPDVRAILLMGDVAIQALNYISARAGEGRAVPAGSTYKIRAHRYLFRGARLYPSYLQAGPSFGIEKSKRRMISEDIASALRLIH